MFITGCSKVVFQVESNVSNVHRRGGYRYYETLWTYVLPWLVDEELEYHTS